MNTSSHDLAVSLAERSLYGDMSINRTFWHKKEYESSNKNPLMLSLSVQLYRIRETYFTIIIIPTLYLPKQSAQATRARSLHNKWVIQ